jgi:hypothetical protein
MYCSAQEVANWFGVHKNTIENKAEEWCKQEGIEGHTFTDLRARYVARTQYALRRAQIASALEGNTAMLIFLGKQLLNQTDDYRGNNSSTWEEDDQTVISQSELVQLLRATREIGPKS